MPRRTSTRSRSGHGGSRTPSTRRGRCSPPSSPTSAASVAVDHTAQTIVTGGEDLRLTGETLRAAVPRLLETADTVDDLEDSLETVADTVEPLQGVANGLGRMTLRFSSA